METETVKVAELKEGDVITSLGNITFPFPFKLAGVVNVMYKGTCLGVQLKASHGWFTPRPVMLNDSATRCL